MQMELYVVYVIAVEKKHKLKLVLCKQTYDGNRLKIPNKSLISDLVSFNPCKQ